MACYKDHFTDVVIELSWSVNDRTENKKGTLQKNKAQQFYFLQQRSEGVQCSITSNDVYNLHCITDAVMFSAAGIEWTPVSI